MADPKELANKARSTLSQALDALQSSPDVPEELLEMAAPIAETMGMLHRIEKGDRPDALVCQQALQRTRGALDALQQVDTQIGAVDAAMEAVAGSLSKLFALSKVVNEMQPAAQPPPPQPAPAAPQPQIAPAAHQPPPQQPPAPHFPAAPEAPFFQGQPQPVFGQPQPGHGHHPPQPGVAEPLQPTQHAAPAQAYMATQPEALGQTVALPQEQAPQGLDRTVALPQGQQQSFAQPQAAPQAAPVGGEDHHVAGTTGMPPPPAGAKIVDVELGAHSGSNFYKGLSGNDVIDHGGIFVATYHIPKVGTPVALKLLLPGDLEFLADGVVQWTRETRGGESEPGFGARITRISPEGRQLVYRYVRNREPMFYDDM